MYLFAKRLAKIHGVGIAIAALISIIISIPPVIWSFSPDFRGVEMMKTNTEIHYVAQVQEIYDGDPWLHNPFFADLKETPFLFPPLSPNLIAWFGKLFGLSAIHTVMATRFVFVAILAVLMYGFTAMISGSRRAGWIAAPFVLLGYGLVDPQNALSFFGFGDTAMEASFIDYGRPINPAVSSIFFFAYLVALWKYLCDDKHERLFGAGAAAVAILGLSFYVYLFTWTFLFTFNGFLFLIYWKRREWLRMKKLVFVSVAAAFAGIPYFLNAYRASLSPDYAASSLRFGFVHTRDWHVSRVVIGWAVLLIAMYRRLPEAARAWYSAFVATAFFVANEQVLTGLYIFNDHYHWYYATPLFLILLSITIEQFVDRAPVRRVIQHSLIASLIVVFFFYGFIVQHRSYQSVLPEVKDEQRYADVFRWLEAEPQKGGTILASYPIMRLVPALTPSDVYFHGTGIYTLIPNERLAQYYLAVTFLNQIPKEDSRQYFLEHEAEIVAFVFGYSYAFQSGVCATCLPPGTIDQMVQAYEMITPENFLTYLKQYSVDYIIWDKKIDPAWELDRFGLQPVAEWNDVVVYDARD